MKRVVLMLGLAACQTVAGIDDIEYGAEGTLPAAPSASAPSSSGPAPSSSTPPPNGSVPPPPPEVVDAGVDATVDAEPDAGVVVPPVDPPVDPGDCTDPDFNANDRRGGNAARVVVFPSPGVQYAPHCMMIKSTQSVTFLGDFALYPLVPGAGVGPLTPIQATSQGTQATFQFLIPGKYKYSSSTSPQSMRGVIQVKGP